MLTLMRTDATESAISEYLDAHATAPVDLLRELGEETAAAFPDRAGMAVSVDEAALLAMLVRMTGVRSAVEVGVFTGSSSLAIATAMHPDGQLLACDVNPDTTAIARRYWARAGVAERIDLRLAPAEETLRALAPEPVLDFVFIDADKENYPVYYAELVPRLRPGGLIVLDNVLLGGRVVDPTNTSPATVAMRLMNDAVAADSRVESVMLPVRDGVTVARGRSD